MIVTPTGIVVFPVDPLFDALTSIEQWASIPTVMDHRLMRTLPGESNNYLFIRSCNDNADYYAIKEILVHDVRSKIEASSP